MLHKLLSPCSLPNANHIQGEMQQSKSKLNVSLYSLCYTEACNKFARAHICIIAPGKHMCFRRNTAAVVSRWQRRNTVFDLTGPIFKPETACSRDERVTAPPTGQAYNNNDKDNQQIIGFNVYYTIKYVGSSRSKYGKLNSRSSPVFEILPIKTFSGNHNLSASQVGIVKLKYMA